MEQEDRILSRLKKILDLSNAGQTEVLFWADNSYLTRFAGNYIHQNVAEEDASISVRVVLDKKIGSASTNLLDDESVEKILTKAIQIAENQKENPHFKSLPSKAEYASVNTFDEQTAAVTPQQRADVAKVVIEEAKRKSLSASGAFSTEVIQIAVANSLGVEAYQSFTKGSLNIVVQSSDGASGYANSFSTKVGDIDPKIMAHQAVEKCVKSRGPLDIKPGEYTLVLEPYAVGVLVAFLGYLGLGALHLQEGRSFMCGKIGQKVAGENITLWDDGLDPQGIPLPFDFEGMPKKKVTFIENGIAKGVVYDSYTAGREEGKVSTGHALPAPNTLGPMPLNLFMSPGDSTVEEMIASTQKGIYVTRFWYTNPVEPVKTVITGMTRDGTFLIEDGKIKGAVKNLRFTESILRALLNISMISRSTRLVEGLEDVGGSVVPAVKIDKFNFTGVTDRGSTY